jgi:hypothetical protein
MHTSLIGVTLFILSPAIMTGGVYVTWMVALSAAFWLALAEYRVANGQLSSTDS